MFMCEAPRAMLDLHGAICPAGDFSIAGSRRGPKYAWNSDKRRRSRRRRSFTTVRNGMIGIDLGTCNSAVAVLKNGVPTIVPVEGGGFLTPSWVSIDQSGESTLIGAAAKQQASNNPYNTFHSFKRLMGRSYREVRAQLGSLAYGVVEAFDGSTQIWCPAMHLALEPAEVSAMLLRHLVQQAQRFTDEDVGGAVITVPAHFNSAQREATREAARLAGIAQVEILQEPVAAALAYGLGGGSEDALVLVFDLGGGTFDVAVVDAFEGLLEVAAAGGDAALGGEDFDRALVDWLAERHMAVGGGDIRSAPLALQRVSAAAEAVKLRLSDAEVATVDLPFIDGVLGIRTSVTRSHFEALTAGLRVRLWNALDAVGQEAGLTWAARPPWDPGSPEEKACELATAASGRQFSSALHVTRPAPIPTPASRPAAAPAGGATPGVNADAGAAAAASASGLYAPRPRRVSRALLVGGGTRVPSVRRLVEAATGVPADCRLDPEQCVAFGAVIRAGLLTGELTGVELGDGAYVADVHGRSSGFIGSAK